MANEFGKVHVGIVASTGGLVAGLNTASTSLQKFGVMAKGIGGPATTGGFQALSTGILGTGVAAKIASFGVKSLTAAFGPLLIVFLAIRAITSIFGALGEATKRAEEVHKMSTALGISAKSYQALSLAAKEAGVEQGTLNSVLLKMNVSLGKLAGDSKSAAAAFTLIGMSAKDFAGLDAGESFEKISEAISKIADPAKRAEAAVAIFGKSGNAAMTAILGLTKALPEATKFLEQMGLVTKDGLKDGVAQIEEMGDALGRLAYPAQGFANLFLKEIAPAVTAATKNFVDWTKTTTDGFSMASLLGKVVAFVIGAIVRAANALYGIFQGLKGVLLLIGSAAVSSFGYILKIIAPIVKGFGGLLTTIENIGRSIINSMIVPLKNLLLLMARAAEATGMTGLAKNLRDSAEAMTELGTASGSFGNWISSFGDSFANWGEQFMAAGADLGQTALDLFGQGAQNLFNGLAAYNASLTESANAGAAAADAIAVKGKEAAKAISASAAELKAIIVDSAAGETFRNDLIRGADPRLNEEHLKKIKDHTERGAEAAEDLASNFRATGMAVIRYA